MSLAALRKEVMQLRQRVRPTRACMIEVDMTPEDIAAGKCLWQVAHEQGLLPDDVLDGTRGIVLLPSKLLDSDIWLACAQAREGYAAQHGWQEWARNRAKVMGLEIILTTGELPEKPVTVNGQAPKPPPTTPAPPTPTSPRPTPHQPEPPRHCPKCFRLSVYRVEGRGEMCGHCDWH